MSYFFNRKQCSDCFNHIILCYSAIFLLNHHGLLWTFSIDEMCLKHGEIAVLNTESDEDMLINTNKKKEILRKSQEKKGDETLLLLLPSVSIRAYLLSWINATLLFQSLPVVQPLIHAYCFLTMEIQNIGLNINHQVLGTLSTV